MALGDYILCCECECKLIYDGDRDKREWWHDRWGKEPQIKCPDCETPQRTWVGLTDEEIELLDLGNYVQVVRIVQTKLKAKNT
ncbi:hypothetical protein UFOVP1466_37 [uncultured Caudovirales phage]|uniref:Uncharacterized protein n=1 Tax=uncultured Caudovirales phage TaxID=2100421 RepID=A0A6J7XHA0_9CAUD|nr:hypothetical protein UFOVP1466_37 [uncultured Caudovirales phage]CAB5229475.1 hypothetical protein UFOVP1554_11 [uncultured Caudovirales phage]